MTGAIAAIIPCLDEEASVGEVVGAVRAQGIATVMVVDGGSRDATAQHARDAGAVVAAEARRGYGRAVQSGVAALSLQQVAAGRIAQGLLRLFHGMRFSDMSPFRAIRRDALDRLGMREQTYGWNLEMLMRVAAAGWSIDTTFLRLAAALHRG